MIGPGATMLTRDRPVGVVEGGDLGQPDDRRLGGDVRPRLVIAVTAADRPRVDDGPAAARQHRRDLVLHAEESAAHVRADAAVELVGVDVGEWRGSGPSVASLIADSTNARVLAGVEEEMAAQRAILLAPRRDPPG
jgi:hypothetical protein